MQKVSLIASAFAIVFCIFLVPYKIYVQDIGIVDEYYHDIQYVPLSQLNPKTTLSESRFADDGLYRTEFPTYLDLRYSGNTVVQDVSKYSTLLVFQFVDIFLLLLFVFLYTSYKSKTSEKHNSESLLLYVPLRYWVVESNGLKRSSQVIFALIFLGVLFTSINGVFGRNIDPIKAIVAFPSAFSLFCLPVLSVIKLSEWIYLGFEKD